MNARPSLTSARNFLLGEGRWREIVGAAVSVLEIEALRLGVEFRPGYDFAMLATTRTLAPLNPRYDVTRSRLTPRNAVWVPGTREGLLVTRQAVRLYAWYEGKTLASASRALEVYHDHPDEAGHREHAIVASPIADRIHGRVAFNGALYVDKALRGERSELGGARLSQIISALNRLLALALFEVDWCIATTPVDHRDRGISERYGWARVEPAAYTESLDTTTNVCLMWSRREDILAEAESIVAGGIAPAEPEPRVCPGMG